MVIESLTKGEFGFFLSFFRLPKKIHLKAHTEHNLSAVKHALKRLCEAALILRQELTHLHKNLARLIKFNSLRVRFRTAQTSLAFRKTIPEVDFSRGILTLPMTVKREATGDRFRGQTRKLEHRRSGDERLVFA